MNQARLGAVIRKELVETANNKLLMFTVFLPPLLLTLFPLILFGVMGNAASNSNLGPEEVARLRALSPDFERYAPGELMQLLAFQQFLLIYLMMPLIIPMTVAAFSIIGEKESRSLEPLLATPVRTAELLLGKSIAAVVPAMLATWLAYIIFFVGSSFVLSPKVYTALLNPMWAIAIVVLAPLLSLLSVSLGIFISSRVNDTRVAQQLSGMLVIPLIVLGLAQTAGFILLNMFTFVAGALVIALADVGVLYLSTRLFQREVILTRWK